MNDKAAGLLEHYDIEVLQLRRGRGAILCDTDKGCLIFKEYTGSVSKLEILQKILANCKEAGVVETEEILYNKEELLYTEDTDGTKYILKTYFENKECNILEPSECAQAAKTLARLHHTMHYVKTEEDMGDLPVFSLLREFEKHTRELKKVWQYLRKKGQKSAFETYLLEKYPYFLAQAEEIYSDYREFFLDSDVEFVKEEGLLCHGDYQHHNIIRDKNGYAILNFEKCVRDNPVRDLAHFMRKALEKNDWSQNIGEGILSAYCKERTLSARSYIELYYRLAYPEKFWKIVNFYYNSRKVWIPEKNGEKLALLWEAEAYKQAFLEENFRVLS